MKKIISLITAFLLLISAFICINTSAAAFEESVTDDIISGDFNDDGVLTAEDLVLIRKQIIFSGAGYDVNADGACDIRDFIHLKKKVASGLYGLGKRVWVDDENGSDSNNGTKIAPFATLTYAFDQADSGGTVFIVGEYDSNVPTQFGKSGKSLTLKGGTLNLESSIRAYMLGAMTIENISVKVGNSDLLIFAGGNKVTIEDTVSFNNVVKGIYGGGNGANVKSTDLTVKSGTYEFIFGGCRNANVTGDTHLNIGGKVNAGYNIDDHSTERHAFGGCFAEETTKNGIVYGNTYVTLEGNARINIAYGGGMGAKSEVRGSCNLTVNGGVSMGFYGGSLRGKITEANVTVNSGEVDQIFGGSFGADVEGNTNVDIFGGTVKRRIYGGCYNDYSYFSGFDTNHHIVGNARVFIGSNVNYTHNSSAEYAICGGSRTDTNFAEENAVLHFENQTIYNTVKNYIGSSQLGINGYDELCIGGFENSVARIGSHYFDALDEALTEANASEEAVTIYLIKDITLNSTAVINGDITVTNEPKKNITVTKGADVIMFKVEKTTAKLTLGTNDENETGKLTVNAYTETAAGARVIDNYGTFVLGKNVSVENGNANGGAWGGILINRKGESHLYGSMMNNTSVAACGPILQYNAEGTVYIYDGVYSGNIADRPASHQNGPSVGGVIYVNAGAVVINGGTFENNTSSGYGGVAYVTAGAALTVNGGTFKGNTAVRDGNALYVAGTAVINGGSFEENQTVFSKGIVTGSNLP